MKINKNKTVSGILGLESGIQFKESEIPPTINGIRDLSSIDNDRNLVPGIRNPRPRGIQNSRLSWIPLHGAKRFHVRTAMWLTLFIYLFIYLFI